MALTLVGGQWQTYQAPPPPQPSAVAPAPPQPSTLRPITSTARTEDYGWRCREVLAHRARRVLFLCFAPLAVTLWLLKLPNSSDLLDPILNVVRAGAWALAASAALLPLLVLRGRRRTTRGQEPPTQLRRYFSLFLDRAPRETLAAYLSSGFLLSGLLALQCGADAPWKFALASSGKGEWQLNEAFLFHTNVLVLFATVSAVQHALQQRTVLVFPEQPTLLSARITSSLTRGLPVALRNAISTYSLSIIGFGMFTFVRKPLIRFLLHYTPLVALFRHHLHALYRGGGVGRVTLTFVGFELGFLAVMWEYLNVLADVYFTQYLLVSGSATNPARCLLDGLQHRDVFVKHFAYQELSLIAQADPTRRIAIYKDIRSTPNGFARVSRECLLLLGRSYRIVEGRGTPKPPASSLASGTSSATGSGTGGEQTAQPAIERATVQRENGIFRPTRKSFFDKLSLSGAAVAAVPPPAPPTSTPASASTTGSQQQQTGPPSIVPDILRSRPTETSSAAKPAQPAPAATSAPAPPYNPLAAVETQLVQRFPQLFGPLPASRVAACLPDPKLNIWACEALSYLVAASLHEDDFGVVQGELPKIFEAFVTYLAALEGLVDELNKQGGPAAEAAVLERITPVVSALQTGLSRMVDAFAPYLGNFRFPPKVAARLQLAVDWGARQKEGQQ